MGVSRVTFIPQSLAAKQLKIKVIEIQHGITQGLTNLYSGYNNLVVDPDFFVLLVIFVRLQYLALISQK